MYFFQSGAGNFLNSAWVRNENISTKEKNQQSDLGPYSRWNDLQPGEPDRVVFLVPSQYFQQLFLVVMGNDLGRDAVEMDADDSIPAELQGF